MADLVNIAKSILKENKYPDEDDVDTQTAYCAGDAFCDGLIKQLTADLKKKGKAAEEAAQMPVYTTQMQTVIRSSAQ